jgi:hypothetical protein
VFVGEAIMTRRERSQRSPIASVAKGEQQSDDPCDEWDSMAVLIQYISASRDWQLLQQRLSTSAKATIRTLPVKKRRNPRRRAPKIKSSRAA